MGRETIKRLQSVGLGSEHLAIEQQNHLQSNNKMSDEVNIRIY